MSASIDVAGVVEGKSAESLIRAIEDHVPEEHEDGSERYLGYAAAVARLKLILLRAKSVALYKAPAMLVKGKKMATVAKAQKKLAYATAAIAATNSAATSSEPLVKPMNPLMQPWVAKTFYGVAASYFAYDVGCDVLRKHRAGHEPAVLIPTAAHGLTFHVALSFGLPALVIKNAVVGSATVFNRPAFASFPRVVRFGPPAVGLMCIPFMPLIDDPASNMLDRCFDFIAPRWREGGSGHHHHHKHHNKEDH